MKDFQVHGIITNGINSDWSKYQRTGTLHLYTNVATVETPEVLLCGNYEAIREITMDQALKNHRTIRDIATVKKLTSIKGYDPRKYTHHKLVEILKTRTTDLGPDDSMPHYKKICLSCVKVLASHLRKYIDEKEAKIGKWETKNGYIDPPEEVRETTLVVLKDNGYRLFGAYVFKAGKQQDMRDPDTDGFDYESNDLEELFDELRRELDDDFESALKTGRIQIYRTESIPIEISLKKEVIYEVDKVKIA